MYLTETWPTGGLTTENVDNVENEAYQIAKSMEVQYQ